MVKKHEKGENMELLNTIPDSRGAEFWALVNKELERLHKTKDAWSMEKIDKIHQALFESKIILPDTKQVKIRRQEEL